MTEETFEEIRELALQVLITSLIAISSVLTTAAVNKIRYGYINRYPSHSHSTRPRHHSIYDEEEDYEENDFQIIFDDD